MADLLIRHLKEKGEQHSSLALLVNQWGFDELLIPKALQTVGSLFPHYSRHDESHSKQILVNIERLLGDNIKLLTATDTWLLLEAAYWHDIGMVVPQKDIADALDQPAFQKYIDSICNESHHELNRFAKSFDRLDMSRCFNGADSPVEAVDNFRHLMAEWFRRQHAERSETTIQTPWNSAGISSPRTELIPTRLFKLLGRICQMHSIPFNELLSPNGLPFKEAGLAQEDCHPRFIACLLRIGDLLDLDDNRFCPVMQRIAGKNRPHISKSHEDKHASIRHLRLDRERIEISAECKTIDGYLETFKWFDWLKQEIQDQMANWQHIAPSRELGLLPTLGTITVRLSGELQLLKEGERPQFSVDINKTVELLQGANLYTTKFACVRELLQNAVDATLLCLWLTKTIKKAAPVNWGCPFSPDIKNLLESTPVKIELTEMPLDSSMSVGESAWKLTVIDQGTGISREDLEYMLRIGGSQRNIQRQSEIKKMPEWMKPSGAFGIGFQSAFLICDKVTLTTKSIFTNETLQVEMHSPTGSKEGSVFLRQMEKDISRPFGTTVEIKLKLAKFAKSWSFSLLDDSSIASQFINLMDPVLDETFHYEAAQIADQICAFARESPVLVEGMLITEDKKKIRPLTGKAPTSTEGVEWNFVKVNNHELAIVYWPTLEWHPRVKTFYRGQEFETKGLYWPNVGVAVNLMSGKAGAWLTASRDALAGNARQELESTVLAALEQQVRHDLENSDSCKLLLDDKNRPTYSLFLKSMALQFGEKWNELAKINKNVDEAWLDLPCQSNTKVFRDFFGMDSWILGEATSQGEPAMSGCDLYLTQESPSSMLSFILNEWLKNDSWTIQVLEPEITESVPSDGVGLGDPPAIIMAKHLQEESAFRVRYQLKKGPQEAYSKPALATRLAAIPRHLSGMNRRFILNCGEEWSHLFLKKDTKVMASYVFLASPRDAMFVLLPFLFRDGARGRSARVEATPEQIDAICNWVLPHLNNETTFADVRKKYGDFIAYIDDTIMKESRHWALWKNARGI